MKNTLFINGMPVSYVILGMSEESLGWFTIEVSRNEVHDIPSLRGRFRVNGNVYDFKEL